MGMSCTLKHSQNILSINTVLLTVWLLTLLLVPLALYILWIRRKSESEICWYMSICWKNVTISKFNLSIALPFCFTHSFTRSLASSLLTHSQSHRWMFVLICHLAFGWLARYLCVVCLSVVKSWLLFIFVTRLDRRDSDNNGQQQQQQAIYKHIILVAWYKNTYETNIKRETYTRYQ